MGCFRFASSEAAANLTERNPRLQEVSSRGSGVRITCSHIQEEATEGKGELRREQKAEDRDFINVQEGRKRNQVREESI